MKIICVVFSIAFAMANGSPCSNLSGTWRNQLGSNMTIQNIGSTSKITGHYNTSVESKTGAAAFSSKISGQVLSVPDGSLVAFNVLWNHGASLTAWVGQCKVCDGQEVLYTSWVLRSLKPTNKRWMSTLINQDTFYRVGDVPAPQHHAETELPHETEEESSWLGKWISKSGESFDITRVTSGVNDFDGLHNSPDSSESKSIFGRIDGNETYSALGYVSAGQNEIKGWAGHIYTNEDQTVKIRTSWLLHAFSDNCNNPRKNVQYGMDTYVKANADAA